MNTNITAKQLQQIEGTTTSQKVVNAIAAYGSIPANLIYKAFELNRSKVTRCVRTRLKHTDSKTRVWISYDAVNKAFVLDGFGTQTPEEYLGYVPAI